MSQTLESQTDHGAGSAQSRTDTWLAEFEAALAARDVERAAGLFAVDSFWRDLVSFTWNITTVEGCEGVADLLRATLDATDPRGFRTSEPAEEADGGTSAWIEFETATGRGKGHLQLNARAEGIPTEVYGLQEVHHPR